MSSDEVCLLDLSHQDDLPPSSPGTRHDCCVVEIDGEPDERTADQTDVTASSPGDSELIAAVPALREGKDKHLFISHSSEDFDDVLAIVNQLEQRFKLSCIISERDFQPGKDIIANIKDSMKRSLKNVFMLTPNFVHSGYCKFERDIAFSTSIESGISSVIPVLLHECDIPTSLVTVTYIDGTLPMVDIPAKIVEALTQSELTAHNLVIDDQIVSRKYKNGYCVRIMAQKSHICWRLKPAEYLFTLREEDLYKLRQAGVQLPKEEIKEAINVLNRSKRVRLFDLTGSCRRLCCLSVCTCPLLYFFLLVVIVVLLAYTRRTILDLDSLIQIGHILLAAIVVVGFILITAPCILPCVCNTRGVRYPWHTRKAIDAKHQRRGRICFNETSKRKSKLQNIYEPHHAEMGLRTYASDLRATLSACKSMRP